MPSSCHPRRLSPGRRRRRRPHEATTKQPFPSFVLRTTPVFPPRHPASFEPTRQRDEEAEAQHNYQNRQRHGESGKGHRHKAPLVPSRLLIVGQAVAAAASFFSSSSPKRHCRLFKSPKACRAARGGGRPDYSPSLSHTRPFPLFFCFFFLRCVHRRVTCEHLLLPSSSCVCLSLFFNHHRDRELCLVCFIVWWLCRWPLTHLCTFPHKKKNNTPPQSRACAFWF